MADVKAMTARVQEEGAFVQRLTQEIGRIIVGQRALVERLLIGLLADGHLLLEGVPGLAKTLSVKTLAAAIQARFQRIQFTPDLLPADLIGTLIYNPREGTFTTKKGPIFANLILADEVNRAPAKVQSALLEAMQERQVTIGEQTYPLEAPFLVLATQNPIEQEGTYPLPEAQVDRFMLKLAIDYPTREEEREIIARMAGGAPPHPDAVISPAEILHARQVVSDIYLDEKVREYILDLVFATRNPKAYRLDLDGLIAYGASPRASLYLTQAAKAHAFLRGRGYVIPEDVKAIGKDVLRHRVIPTYEAEAQELTADAIVQKVFDRIDVP